jgi:ADP-heptose:LPS heptosyltransferase
LLRDAGTDTIVHLHADIACCEAAERLGVPVRIGPRQNGITGKLTDAISCRKRDGSRHEASYNFDFLRRIGVDEPAELRVELPIGDGWAAGLERKLPFAFGTVPYAVVHPCACDHKPKWALARFSELADWLWREKGLRVVLVGLSRLDNRFREVFHNGFKEGFTIDLLNRTSLTELAALLHHSRILVSNDSGPVHLAVAVGCPVVSLFGQADAVHGPTRWQPISKNSRTVVTPARRRPWETPYRYGARGFEAITVKEVQVAVEKVLAGR